MSVKELRIVNDKLTVLKVTINRAPFMDGDRFYFKLVDGTTLTLKRDQAHMLYLYLQEHLK